MPQGLGKIPRHQLANFFIRPFIGTNKTLKGFPFFSKKLSNGFRALTIQSGNEPLYVLAPGFSGFTSFPKEFGIGNQKFIQILNKPSDLGNRNPDFWRKGGRASPIHKLPPQKYSSEDKDMQIRFMYKHYLLGQSS